MPAWFRGAAWSAGWTAGWLRAGSASYVAEEVSGSVAPVQAEADHLGATAVLVAENGQLAGAILLRDRVREGVREAVRGLRSMGIGYQVMLTGDRRGPRKPSRARSGSTTWRPNCCRSRSSTASGNWHRRAASWRWWATASTTRRRWRRRASASRWPGRATSRPKPPDVVYLPHSLEKLPQLFEVSRRAMRDGVAEHRPVRRRAQSAGRAGLRHRETGTDRRRVHAPAFVVLRDDEFAAAVARGRRAGMVEAPARHPRHGCMRSTRERRSLDWRRVAGSS